MLFDADADADDLSAGGTCNSYMFHCAAGDRCVPSSYSHYPPRPLHRPSLHPRLHPSERDDEANLSARRARLQVLPQVLQPLPGLERLSPFVISILQDNYRCL
ncbi:hypothetical protein C0Q70_09597 [Pomacea canaliculata]|uniref:Uncharacterized protein n=1 Tax=Pomacea canaliculata TaxID=400727 RepID=A0A2T7PA92_POMCA|nr:hypothetical protein C0Q70_09597 [Pomacea canaliculata]